MRQSVLYDDVIFRKETTDRFFSAKGSVLKTLIYFDIFHYPLTREEIKKFLPVRAEDDQLNGWLMELEAEKTIFRFHEFYSIQNNPLLVHRRREGNEKAARLLVKANRIGRFLYRFPFVRAVGISGSLSKDYADERADIDFFIIAKADRLWLARTFMHLFKKLTFLTGRQHYYCMNYYIDERSLLLKEQNIFIATEAKTLVPVCGEKTMNHFFAVNDWAGDWLPQCAFRQQEEKDPGKGWFKQVIEWLFKGKTGNRIDNFLFHLTQKRWNRKILKERRNKKGARMALLTNKHFAKSNPDDFQEKVLVLYQQKLSALGQTVPV
jgi:hypothetical protein